MRFFSFFHLPRHREFNFQPRYYDPIKEEIEERVKMIKKEQNSEQQERNSMISAAFRRRQNQNKTTSINQFLILAILVTTALFYWYWGNQGVLFILIPAIGYWILRKTRGASKR